MTDRVVALAPGRVNLIGEHTDYNGGLALPFAIEQGVRVTATRRPGDQVRVSALDLDERDDFDLRDPGRAPGWRAFARGVLAELAGEGLPVTGADLEVSADLPIGSGLSSSAALCVALSLAVLGLSDADHADRLLLARLCSRVENDWAGARTGLLDQTASLLGRRGHAVLVDFHELDVRQVACELGDWALVVVDSGDQHDNAGAGYEQRRTECARAAEALGVGLLADADPAAVAALPEPLRSRARHVLTEDGRVTAAVEALRTGDLPAVGRLLDASHASLRDGYDASTPAVEQAVAGLRSAGAAGARMVGGGFGGHVLGLLPPGVPVPDGARAVAPADGARVLERA